MSFHNKTLLGGSGSAPGAPLTLDEEKETERKLRMLTADPINAVFEDREFKMFKTKQFERAFPGKQKLDATGRGMDTPPVVRDVEPFEPTLRRDDLNIAGSVGEEARNRPADVIKVKKALANTRLFDFDVTREKSTDAGPMFRDATKAFQRANGIEADGCIKPNCPTHKAIGELFFPEGGTNSKATPVDLRPTAARAGAATLGDGAVQVRSGPEGPKSDSAEFRIERPIPPIKRPEFKRKFDELRREEKEFQKAVARFVNADNPDAIRRAVNGIFVPSSLLVSSVAKVAEFLNEKSLTRSATEFDKKVNEIADSIAEGKEADIEGLIAQWNKTRALMQLLLSSRRS